MKKTSILKALLWASLMTPATLFASGCSLIGGCTQAGCEDLVSVEVQGLAADQLYEVDIETAGGIVQCAIDTSTAMITCDNAWFYSIDQGVATISVTGAPASVAITVRQDETVIVQEEARPDYDEFAPNGRACGPICKQADVAIQL